MIYFKKLIFSLPFFIFLGLFYFYLNGFIQNANSIIGIDPIVLLKTLLVLIFLIISGAFFAIFISFSSHPKFVLPVILLASLIPFVVDISQQVIFAVGSFFVLLATYWLLNRSLKGYLTFSPTAIFSPGIKNFTRIMILLVAVCYFIVINTQIQQKGFEVPDSIIDPILNAFSTSEFAEESFDKLPISLTPEQLSLAKQNPEALRQYGIDPAVLDNLTKQTTQSLTPTNLIKDTAKSQLNTLIAPYLNFLPIIFALLLFLSLTSASSILFIFLPLLLWAIFYLLEKTKFIRYEKEMREVKKMVI